MARNSDPVTHAVVVTGSTVMAIFYGVLLADDSAVRELEEACSTAEGSSDDTALGLVEVHVGYRAVCTGTPRRTVSAGWSC